MQARIRVDIVDDFPDVENGITFPTSLKAVKFEVFLLGTKLVILAKNQDPKDFYSF